MGFFDSAANSYFKTTEDGNRVFFPWGVFGRGYCVSSEIDYERLRGQIKTIWIVFFVIIISSFTFINSIFGGVATLLAAVGIMLLFYIVMAIWTHTECSHMSPASGNVKITLNELNYNNVKSISWAFLWFGVIGSFLFCAIGLLILVVDPENWLVAICCILFCGCCFFVYLRTAIMKKNLERSNESEQ